MKRALWTAVVAAVVAAASVPADAGEGLITKVRGRTLTIDKGADDGIELGLEVTVVRQLSEAIIHPLTGENLGAPEIELASGKVNKVAARAASVVLDEHALIGVQPGDVARFMTLEEKMVMDQEVATEEAEQAAKERTEIRSEASRLGRNISSIQGSIRGLENAIRELRRFDDDVVKPQFNAINRQIGEMRDELKQLKETVSLLNAVPVQDITEGGREMTPEETERVRTLVQEEIDKLQSQLAAVTPPPVPQVQETPPPPPPPEPEVSLEEEDLTGFGGEPIFAKLWLWLAVGAVGLGGIAFWIYTRLTAGGSDEDDEEIADEDEEEEEEEAEVDVEEEDDIVVEETS